MSLFLATIDIALAASIIYTNRTIRLLHERIATLEHQQ